MNLNCVVITGRVATQLKLSRTQKSNIEFCRFWVAVKRPGNPKVTDFIPVTAWRQNAVFVTRYLEKGQRIEVEGTLSGRIVDNKLCLEVIANQINSPEYRKKHTSDEKRDVDTSNRIHEEAPEENPETPNCVDVTASEQQEENFEGLNIDEVNEIFNTPDDDAYFYTTFGIPYANEFDAD